MASFGRLALLLVLCVSRAPARAAPQPALTAQPAPWSGIVGFLSMVARLQQRPAEPAEEEAAEDADGPLRKIVYAVEEQTSGGEDALRSNGSMIVFDSARDQRDPPAPELGAKGQVKRSAEAAATGRQTAAGGTRPYLIGRKLWYVPLWFSIYLILYITALTVKSVARHRIKYPTLVSEDDLLAKRRNGLAKSESYTRRVTNAISNGEKRYQQYM